MKTPSRDPGVLNRAVAGEIRAELARRQWSQAELASKMGVDQMWLSRRLRAVKPLTLTEFEAIAEALEMTPAELMAAAVGRVRQTTRQYSPLAEKPMSPRPSRGPGGPTSKAHPSGGQAVRRLRRLGTPAAVATTARVA